jgi:ferredoxin
VARDSRDGLNRRLRVNPVACDGVGICGHLAAELVRFDSWGYPIVTERALDQRDLNRATAAVAACPKRALFIQDSRH